jgi:hypothetical protein
LAANHFENVGHARQRSLGATAIELAGSTLSKFQNCHSPYGKTAPRWIPGTTDSVVQTCSVNVRIG